MKKITIQELKKILVEKLECKHEFEENLNALLPHKKCKFCGKVYFLDFEKDPNGENSII